MPILTCPSCKQQLGLPDENLGAVVRCPSCNTTFSSRPETLPQTAVRAPQPLLPSPDNSGAFSEIPISPRRPPEPDYNQYDSRWNDDDPLSIKRKTAKNQAPLLAIFVGLVLAVLLVVGVTVLMRPGILGGGNGPAQQGPLDLLSLAPADSVLLFGITAPKGQQNDPLQLEEFRKLADQGVPKHLVELIMDAEHVVFAGNYANDKPRVLGALLTKQAYDKDKVKKDLELGPPRILEGVAIYTMKTAWPQVGDVFVAMPDPRVLVGGVMPEAEFVKALLNHGKAPVLSAELLTRARALQTANMWVLLANQGIVKQKLQEFNPRDFPQLKGFADEIAILQRSTTFSLVFLMVNKDLRIELSVECAKDTDGIKLQKFVNDSWKASMQLLKLFVPDPKIGRVFNDVNQTFKVEQRGTAVVASTVISEATVEEMKKQMPNGK